MKAPHAEFRAAAARVSEIPAARGPEIALAGRSNVGKSSLINRLTGRRGLARTSRTPGCTRGLIFYEIGGGRVTLVDLPGYGWAQRSKQERSGWKALIEYYLENRKTLAGVLVLVDVRRGPGEEERMLTEYLTSAGVAHGWLLTKCDKLSRGRLAARLRELQPDFGGAPAIATSAESGLGMDAVWRWIGEASEKRKEASRDAG
jgi:GTP-binding protein